MTPEDRKLARELMMKKLLTVEQVTKINEVCKATGRPFAKVAAEKGILTPQEADRLTPRSSSTRIQPWPILLAASAVILSGLLVFTPFFFELEWGLDDAAIEERVRMRAETARQAAEVHRAYQRKIITERSANAAVDPKRARATMAFVEERLDKAVALPDLYRQLTESIISFTDYLRVHPDDARALTERARAYEIRGDFGRAVQDLEQAIALDKTLEPEVRNTLQELRLKLPK